MEAFDQLISEGYLTTQQGSGTSISQDLPDPAPKKRIVKNPADRPSANATLSARAIRYSASPFPPTIASGPIRAFLPNQPSVDHFPIHDWSRISSRRSRNASREILRCGDPMGYPPLREAVAAYLGSSRGVHCSADQVMIVSGTQQALDLVARVVLDPGDQVWIEDPGYSGAASVLKAWDAQLIPVPVDTRGMRVQSGIRDAPGARLAYVTPAHQFPLGTIMAPERRQQLLDWSQARGAWIFEDDYDSEFRFSGRPVAALQGHSSGGNVIFSGSFNKMLFPALRQGFVVLPEPLIDPIRKARSMTDRYGATLDQAVLCDFITEGHLGRHLRRMRQTYTEHHTILLDAAKEELAGLLEIQPTETGLQTVGWLQHGWTDLAATRAAAQAGIDVVPLSDYAFNWSRKDGLQIGFGAVPSAAIKPAVRKLSKALQKR